MKTLKEFKQLAKHGAKFATWWPETGKRVVRTVTTVQTNAVAFGQTKSWLWWDNLRKREFFCDALIVYREVPADMPPEASVPLMVYVKVPDHIPEGENPDGFFPEELTDYVLKRLFAAHTARDEELRRRFDAEDRSGS